MRINKLTALFVATILFTGAVSASVGFTETDEIPESFSGGDTFEIDTTFENTEGEPVPVLFQLETSSEEFDEIPVEAFDLEITDTSLEGPAPCSFGDTFSRNVCAYHSVPDGEHDVTFEVSANTRLHPGKYNLTLQLLSLEGEMYLGELLGYWGNPTNITRGETTTLTDGSVEADIRPSAPEGEDETEEAWAHAQELDDVLQESPDGKQFITGAQVLVNEDICEKSLLKTDFLGEDAPAISCDVDNEKGDGLDVALVLDRSGSMSGSRIEEARDGGRVLVNGLGSSDQSAAISFANGASLDQELTFNKTAVKEAINATSSGGGTDMEDGVDRAHTELLNGTNARENANKVMVVLGDGDVNTDGAAAKEEGVRIIAIALAGADEEMKDLASSEDDYYVAETAEDLEGVFGEVQKQINDDYVKNVTEDTLFGGDTGELDANGTVRFSFDRSDYVSSTVSVYRFNNTLEGEEPRGWEELESRPAPGGAIEADVDKFSVFAVFGERTRAKDPEPSSPSREGGVFSLDPEFEANVNGLNVEFADSTQTYRKEIESYQWNFGDGENSTGSVTNHAYTEEGTYEVTLTLTDEDGGSHTGTQQVQVNNSEETEQPGNSGQDNQNPNQGNDGSEETGDEQPPQSPTGLFAGSVSSLSGAFGSLIETIRSFLPF